MARVVKSTLEEQGADLESIWDGTQNRLENDYFVGCFTDGENADHMWREYALGDGICIWFEPDYSKIHRIIYADYLAKADELRDEYRAILYRAATERYESFHQDFSEAVRESVNLSMLSCFTKKLPFVGEREWREVVLSSCGDSVLPDGEFKFIIHSIPGKIVRVESRMPE